MAEHDRFDPDRRPGAVPPAETTESGHQPRTAVAEEQVVYRAEDEPGVHGAGRPGFDLAATLGGLLAAIGSLLLLSGLLSAIVGAGAGTGADETSLSVGAAVGGVIVLFLALLAGGWVAGRMARHDGGKHGLVTAVWMVVLVALLGALGAFLGDRFDVADRLGLSQWLDGNDVGPIALISGLLALAAMLLGGWLGGRLGGRHHSTAAVEVVETRHGVSEQRGGIISGQDKR